MSDCTNATLGLAATWVRGIIGCFQHIVKWQSRRGSNPGPVCDIQKYATIYHAKLARSIEDKLTSKGVDDDDKKDQIFESALPPPALLPLNLNSEVVTNSECGCIEKYKLEGADPANSTRLQGKGTTLL